MADDPEGEEGEEGEHAEGEEDGFDEFQRRVSVWPDQASRVRSRLGYIVG